MALDLAFARAQFPALSDGPSAWIYLDNAGGSQILGSVVDRIREYLLTSNVQIGTSYAVSMLAEERLRHAQAQLAEYINAERPEEIVFGPSSTVMLQTLARGLAPGLRPGDEIVVSDIDREANIGPWLSLASLGVTIRRWTLNGASMTLEASDLEGLLSSRTRLVDVRAWDVDYYVLSLYIEELGLADRKGVVRASFAHYNTLGDTDRLIDALDRVL